MKSQTVSVLKAARKEENKGKANVRKQNGVGFVAGRISSPVRSAPSSLLSHPFPLQTLSPASTEGPSAVQSPNPGFPQHLRLLGGRVVILISLKLLLHKGFSVPVSFFAPKNPACQP